MSHSRKIRIGTVLVHSVELVFNFMHFTDGSSPATTSKPIESTLIGQKTCFHSETWNALRDELSESQCEQIRAESDCFFKQGISERLRRQYDIALNTFQQALQGYRQVQAFREQGKVLIAMALTYYNLADYFWAMDYARQGLTIAREVGDRPMAQQALNHLGNS